MPCPPAMSGPWSGSRTSGGYGSADGGFAIDVTMSTASSQSLSSRPAATSTSADISTSVHRRPSPIGHSGAPRIADPHP